MQALRWHAPMTESTRSLARRGAARSYGGGCLRARGSDLRYHAAPSTSPAAAPHGLAACALGHSSRAAWWWGSGDGRAGWDRGGQLAWCAASAAGAAAGGRTTSARHHRAIARRGAGALVAVPATGATCFRPAWAMSRRHRRPPRQRARLPARLAGGGAWR
jgi:hypothetical protein